VEQVEVSAPAQRSPRLCGGFVVIPKSLESAQNAHTQRKRRANLKS